MNIVYIVGIVYIMGIVTIVSTGGTMRFVV